MCGRVKVRSDCHSLYISNACVARNNCRVTGACVLPWNNNGSVAMVTVELTFTYQMSVKEPRYGDLPLVSINKKN